MKVFPLSPNGHGNCATHPTGSCCFRYCCYCIGQHSSFFQKVAKLRPFSLKTSVKSVQTWSLSSNICSKNFHEFPAKLAKFVSKNPVKFDFFPHNLSQDLFNDSPESDRAAVTTSIPTTKPLSGIQVWRVAIQS